MKLTIIVDDKTVCEDNICYSKLVWEGTPSNVHALQWQDVAGWIEFNDGNPNETIDVLPDWALNAEAAWTAENTKPTPDPLPPTAQQNKQTASYKLYETDWTTIPDVADPQKSNPYLINPDEFIAYRNSLRAIAINPTEGFLTWPVKPKTIWSS